MNLSQLREKVAQGTGLKVEINRDQLTALVNTAAQELYTQTDLPRALMEETVQVSLEATQRITLPAHMYDIRAVRDYIRGIVLHDMRPRYHNYPWPKGDMYKFRICDEVATCYSWDNATELTISAVDEDVTISVTGKTEDAALITQVYDNDGVGATVDWVDVIAISKSGYTTKDVVVTNPDGVEVARILNYLEKSRYIQIELLERPQTPLSPAVLQPARVLDVLYKPHFRPLVNDTDSFQLEGYDQAIINKARALRKLDEVDENNTENKVMAAKVADSRSQELLKNTIRSREQGIEIQVQFGRPKGDMSRLRGLRRFKYRRDNP